MRNVQHAFTKQTGLVFESNARVSAFQYIEDDPFAVSGADTADACTV